MTYFFPNLEPVCCSMSSSNCCFLTCILISQEAGQEVWYSHLLKSFPDFVVIHTVKGFGIVKTEINVFLELSSKTARTYTGLGKQTLGGHKQNLVCTRILRPWNFLGKSTGVCCHFLLQEIFLTQGLNPGLPHYRQMLYRLSHQGSPHSH